MNTCALRSYYCCEDLRRLSLDVNQPYQIGLIVIQEPEQYLLRLNSISLLVLH